MTNTNVLNRSTFVGAYVDDLRDLYVTSLVTGWHSLVIGAPGWGKTDIATSLLTDVYGPDGFLMLRLNESMLPNKIEGSTDMNHLINHSEFRLNPANTPYDPRYRAVIMDEMGRGNDAAYSLFMDVLDRKEFKSPVPVLATANFLPTGKKYEGLFDRFALWHWVTPGALDARKIAIAQATRRETDPMLQVPGRLPTVAELDFCYNALPGPDALDALGDAIDLVQAEATKSGKLLHPRRIGMFAKILLRMGYYLTGSDNFSKIPEGAMQALRFAWPSPVEAEYKDWGSLIAKIKDPVQAAIDGIRSLAAVLVNEAAGKTDLTDDDKLGYIKSLMQFDKSMKTLIEQYPGNAAVLAARQEIKSWTAKITDGEKVDRL